MTSLRRSFRSGSSLGVFLVIATVISGGSPPAAAEAFDLRQGVVVDDARGIAYVARPGGVVEALNLLSGSSIWQSSEAALPLALCGSFLLAQAEHPEPGPLLRLVVLDVDARGRTVTEAVRELPRGVHALITDDLQRSFRVVAEPLDAGFVVSWSYREIVVEGVRRADGEPPPELKLSGAMRVDIPQTAATSGRTNCPDRNSKNAAAPNDETFRHATFTVGNVRAGISGGRGEALELKRWNACTGERLKDVTLSPRAITSVVSADRKHVLAGERVGKGGERDPEYRWSIFSLATGKRLGSIRRDVSAAPFFIWKNTVVFVAQPRGFRRGETWVDQPLALVGVRLKSGTEAWQREIRDTEYRGPSPPAP